MNTEAQQEIAREAADALFDSRRGSVTRECFRLSFRAAIKKATEHLYKLLDEQGARNWGIVPPAQPQRSDLPRPFAKPIKDGDPVIDLKGIRNPPTPDQPRDCGEWTWKKHPTIVRGEFTCVISYGEQVIASLEFESDAKRICDAHNAALAAKPLKTYERHLLEQELAAEREQCKAIVEHCTEEGRKLEREVWEAAVKNRRLPEPQCNVPKSKKKFMNGKQKIYTRPCYGGKWLEIHIGKRRFILSYSDVMKLKRTLDKELEEADAIIERR